MQMAISRYGARVLPNTEQLIADAEARGEFLDGPQIAEFEKAFANWLGGDVTGVSASYGRMAFHYILKAMDLPAGADIVFPALTFWVMPEVARAAGYNPVFADVCPATFNMTADSLRRVITSRTAAVVPTHLWGLPCDMDEIVSITRAHGAVVIEDCAHALGATYRGKNVGTIGDASIFSLQTLKPLNTYGGGMAVARDPQLAARIAAIVASEPAPTMQTVKKHLRLGRTQRITIQPNVFSFTLFPLLWTCAYMRWNPDPYFWEKIRPLSPLPMEYRERYSNVQATIGLESIKRLSHWTACTQANAGRVTNVLRSVGGIRVPEVPPDRTHAYYQLCAYLPKRDAAVFACLKRGVDLETLHVDVCPHMEIFGGSTTPVPGADATTAAVQIPIYESLSSAQLERVASVVAQSAVA
jgi:dTDP-4-amino-4,6-dideoxygalactose transaminase